MLSRRVAQRFAAKKHYRVDDRKLKAWNRPSVWREQAAETGFYQKYDIRILPLRDVMVPKVWSAQKFDDAKRMIEEGRALDPIDVSKVGGKWKIGDGIHRSNASLALGLTHVPALVATDVPAPEWYEAPEPEKPRLRPGDWVAMRAPTFDGYEVGWVDERLPSRRVKGVERHYYALTFVNQKGDRDFGDHGDHEFDPLPNPPGWARRLREVEE